MCVSSICLCTTIYSIIARSLARATKYSIRQQTKSPLGWEDSFFVVRLSQHSLARVWVMKKQSKCLFRPSWCDVTCPIFLTVFANYEICFSLARSPYANLVYSLAQQMCLLQDVASWLRSGSRSPLGTEEVTSAYVFSAGHIKQHPCMWVKE